MRTNSLELEILTVKSFKIRVVTPFNFADKEEKYCCCYHGYEQCWKMSLHKERQFRIGFHIHFFWQVLKRHFLAMLNSAVGWKSASIEVAASFSLKMIYCSNSVIILKLHLRSMKLTRSIRKGSVKSTYFFLAGIMKTLAQPISDLPICSWPTRPGYTACNNWHEEDITFILPLNVPFLTSPHRSPLGGGWM